MKALFLKDDFKSYSFAKNYAFSLYLFFNISSACYFIFEGYLGGDFNNRGIVTDNIYMVLSLLSVFCIFSLYLYVIYPLFFNFNIKKIPCVKSFSLDAITLFVILFGLYSAVKYNIGVFGVDGVVEPGSIFFRRIYAIVQPIYFGVIYFYYKGGFKGLLTKINVFLYVCLIVSSGQTGQILLLFFLWVYSSVNYHGKSVIPKVLLLTLLGLSVYPFVRMIKDSIIGSYLQGGNPYDALSGLLNVDLLNVYFYYFFVSLERFQIVANFQYLFQNADTLYLGYNLNNGSLFSFFSNHWFVVFLGGVFDFTTVPESYLSPQSFLALSINGFDNWASHCGLLGFFIFYKTYSLFVILFTIFTIFIVSIMSRWLSHHNGIRFLSFLFILQLICHGWIFAFVYYMQTLLFFILFIIFCHFLKLCIHKLTCYDYEFKRLHVRY